MLENSNTSNRPGQGSHKTTRLAFFGVLIVLLLIQLFVTFRGLSSPLAMDQAQMARAIARGEGFHTQVVRPYAWRQMLDAGKDMPATKMVDTSLPPLPSLVLAPFFKVLSRYSECGTETRVYAFDRVVAGISLLFFFAAIAVTSLTVERLFDSRIAAWSVLGLVVCQWLWDVATGGIAHMMVLFFFSCAAFLVVLLLERGVDERRGGQGIATGIGLLLALMLFCHWMTIWLIFGLVIAMAVFVKPRYLAAIIAIPVVLALVGWGMRNHGISGDFMGGAKSIVQSIFSLKYEPTLLRDFSGAPLPIFLSAVLRKLEENFTNQFSSLFVSFGMVVPAILFFLTLLHPFKRPETAAMRWMLAIVWLMAAVGMLLVGLPEGEKDDNLLHYIFVPLFSAYGLAFLVVLWSRLSWGKGGGWFAHNGALLAGCVVIALPMLATLPGKITFGLNAQGNFAQWPPYLPDRFAKLKTMVAKEELLVSDMPWAIAWYADRTCVWLPMEQDQLESIRKFSAGHNENVAGIIFTPWSARGNHISDVFDGDYHAWAAQILRGMGVGFGVDTMVHITGPYKEFYPLAGQPLGEGRFIAEMVFMADKKRWD